MYWNRLVPAPQDSVPSFTREIAAAQRVRAVGVNDAGQLGLGLSPLENRRLDYLFHDLFRQPATAWPKLQRNQG